jgi:hypothetical protein
MVMKKTKYIAPDFAFTEFTEEEMICVVSKVGEGSVIEMGNPEKEQRPTDADSRAFKPWEDEDEW